MTGTPCTAYERNPQYWAKGIREKVSPFTLQCEIVQMLLYDYDASWSFPAFAEWTGDPDGWGHAIKSIHTKEEIRAALDAIGYSRKRGIHMGNDLEDGAFRLWEARAAEEDYAKMWARLSDDVNRAYWAFWKKRGMRPPYKISSHFILPNKQ